MFYSREVEGGADWPKEEYEKISDFLRQMEKAGN
jgi:hypothetical protein